MTKKGRLEIGNGWVRLWVEGHRPPPMPSGERPELKRPDPDKEPRRSSFLAFSRGTARLASAKRSTEEDLP